MRKFSITIIGALVFGVTGCSSTPTCPTELTCVATDASVDARMDASDASIDTAPLPCNGRCDESRCRALGDAGVPTDTGVGDAGNTPDEMGRVCVECTSSGHCPSGSATPACNTNTFRCVECVGTGDCNNNANGTACISNKCGCDDAADCNGKACKPNGDCSAFDNGTVGRCGECDTDRNCAADDDHLRCVQHAYSSQGETHTSAYCMPQPNSLGCGLATNIVLKPFHNRVNDALSVDGDEIDICKPGGAVSCEAIADRINAVACPPETDASCGRDDLLNDGLCRSSRCSYFCSSLLDCPGSEGCISGACQ